MTTPSLRDAAQAAITAYKESPYHAPDGTFRAAMDALVAALAAPADALAEPVAPAKSEAQSLLEWYDQDGFDQGTKAPSKWVLQAVAELRILDAENQSLRATHDRLLAVAMTTHAAFSQGWSDALLVLRAGGDADMASMRRCMATAKIVDPATQLQQAVARALEELKFHPDASHVEPNYRDWFNKTIDAAIRAN